MNSEERLAEISEKLDRILGLMATQGVDDDGEKVSRLRALGMDNATIASLTGLTINAVAIRVSRLKKARG